MAKQTHVVPNPNGGWDSKDAGNQKASKHFETKKEAVDWARGHSKDIGSELFIHNMDGTISQKDSHGPDKCPPKG